MFIFSKITNDSARGHVAPWLNDGSTGGSRGAFRGITLKPKVACFPPPKKFSRVIFLQIRMKANVHRWLQIQILLDRYTYLHEISISHSFGAILILRSRGILTYSPLSRYL